MDVKRLQAVTFAVIASVIIGSVAGARLYEFVSSIEQKNNRDHKAKMAILAYQVLDQYQADLRKVATNESPTLARSNRGLASAVDSNTPQARSKGTIGQDPWGRPYSYVIESSIKGLRVIVVSSGPDGIQQVKMENPVPGNSDDEIEELSLSEKNSFR